MENKEVKFIKELFYTLGRSEKEAILKESNLDNKELKLLKARLIEGLSIKEISNLYGLEIDTYNKTYHRAMLKLYAWLERKAIALNIDLTNF